MFTHVVLAIQVQKIHIGEPMTANEAHYCMYRARDLYEVLYMLEFGVTAFFWFRPTHWKACNNLGFEGEEDVSMIPTQKQF